MAGKEHIPAPQPTPICKLSLVCILWNISTGQLGSLAGYAPSQHLHTCSLAENEKMKKVLDFLATTENISVYQHSSCTKIQNTAATGRKTYSVPAYHDTSGHLGRRATYRITESQNHRTVGVGRDLCGSSSPIPLLKQGRLQQAEQDCIQVGLEYLQRRRLHNLLGQPVSVLRHPQREEVLAHVQTELPVLQFVPIVPCPVAGHH